MSFPTSYPNQATAEFEAARMLALKNQEIADLREEISSLLRVITALTFEIEVLRCEAS
jgi:hypothetical protein